MPASVRLNAESRNKPLDMNFKKITAALSAALLALSAAYAQPGPSEFDRAMDLYQKGLYSEARNIFSSLEGNDPINQGYALLCAEKMNGDYALERQAYLANWPYSGLVPQIQFQHGLNCFDDGDYTGARLAFSDVSEEDMAEKDVPEFLFKQSYAKFMDGDSDGALYGLGRIERLPYSDYTAPARYTTGYIWYAREDFKQARDWFEQSARDPRFEDLANYYIMECRFMEKDYRYVTQNAAEMYSKVPAERKPHLARIISEAYLIQGNATEARRYFNNISGTTATRDRGELFYAGSLLYATQDYAGAIENYSLMPERTDSLGQIANYQMGYSYIQTKNKVAALDAFQAAANQTWDPQIQEDAFFNYAKLSFDLNNNSGPFDAYLQKFPEADRGERIYSYMALAALHNHDYAAAVAAYDNIEELDPDQQGNYMKAHYLRANQLIRAGSWRAAEPALKAAAYYTDRHSGINQLSRYWLAESYFRDGNYAESRSVFNDLYNISALDNRIEGKLLPYNIAYTYFQEGDYNQASKWFGDYAADSGALYRKDAIVRQGDCAFLQKRYTDAIKSYNAAMDAYPDKDDVYPVYQAGLAYGLANQADKKIEMLSRARNASVNAPFYGDAMYELGRAYVAKNQNDRATEVFKGLVQSSRDTSTIARSLIELGMISRNRSRYDEALGYYKQVVEKYPQAGYADDALLAIESIYQAKQEPENYLAYVEAIGKSPARTDAERGQILFSGAEQVFLAGNYQKALTSLQAYEKSYPAGESIRTADFYIAECYRMLDMKDQACDYYRKVIDAGEGNFLEQAALQYARLSYGMERYEDALAGYDYLGNVARIESNRHVSALGLMRSAYGLRSEEAIRYVDRVLLDTDSTADEKREAEFIKAKTYLGANRRTEAFEIFTRLAKSPSTAEGAEAAYLKIQDAYDQGMFTDVQNQTFDFSEKAGNQTYWLAKAFLLLGDSYVEQEDIRQAKATFESIRDGYSVKNDGILEEVEMRLKKLNEQNN